MRLCRILKLVFHGGGGRVLDGIGGCVSRQC